MSKQIKSIVEELVQPILGQEQFELVDIEYVKEGKNWFLRVFIDKEGGIDIEDCGKVSEALSALLDQKDPISEAYFLEVSSPGAERPLKKIEDYHKAVHKNVFVVTAEAIGGTKEFEGQLLSFDGEELVIDSGKKKVVLPFQKVESARLAIAF